VASTITPQMPDLTGVQFKAITTISATANTAGSMDGADCLLILYGMEGVVTADVATTPVGVSDPPLLLTGSRTFD